MVPMSHDYHRCKCDECSATKRRKRREWAEKRKSEKRKCAVDGCVKRASGADRHCGAHAARLALTGDVGPADSRANDGVARTYSTAHNQVRLSRGSASGYGCVDCGQPAADWSLSVSPSLVVVDMTTGRHRGHRFSPNAADYEPRCKPCHATLDGYGGSRGRHRDPSTGRFVVSATVRNSPES